MLSKIQLIKLSVAVVSVVAVILLIYFLTRSGSGSSKLDTRIKVMECTNDADAETILAMQQESKKGDSSDSSTCGPYVSPEEQAEKLVKQLMTSARDITKAKGQNKKYYQQLLRAVYHRFLKLNATVVNRKELQRSRKFLAMIKKQVDKYESELQHGGMSPINDTDVDQILDKSEYAIYEVYPSLI